MRNVVRQIDRAIKKLYNLESPHRAENFLIEPNSPKAKEVPALAKEKNGAVIVQYDSFDAGNVDLGIFLGEPVKNALSKIDKLSPEKWMGEQAHALSVAAEEISHFHYLVYRFDLDHTVSQLELELQGEIDKFLLLFFSVSNKAASEGRHVFDSLFEQIFYRFSWSTQLNAEQKQRYAEANAQAKQFIKNFGERVINTKSPQECLEYLRTFYRLSQSEKLGFISRLQTK